MAPRFRTLDPHWAAKNGWLAGVAGGYGKADMPTTKDLGATFSRFDKWDAKTSQKHVEAIKRDCGGDGGTGAGGESAAESVMERKSF